MPDYECPNCNGGFPEPKPTESGPECPWCGEAMNGESKHYGSVLKPPDSNVTTPSISTPDIGPSNDGTTPCPECGDPMPMGTWVGPKPKCRKCRRNEGPSLGSGIQQRMSNSSEGSTISTTGSDIEWGEDK